MQRMRHPPTEEETLWALRFEAGELGDAADFFDWAGMFELRRDLLERIDRLEQAL